LKKQLPGIDCGACGAPSCEALAEDVVCGLALPDSCIFMQTQHQKDGTLSMESGINIRERIWGKDRFKNNHPESI
jgi:Na+-translocating ferredoxin:NAD+ oxidoreductase RNF subunit RnfB